MHAVIDFGGLGVGDPACDVMIAWGLFTGASRAAFRAALEVDDAHVGHTARGHALSKPRCSCRTTRRPTRSVSPRRDT